MRENQSVLSPSVSLYSADKALSGWLGPYALQKGCSRCLTNRGGREWSPHGTQMILERTCPREKGGHSQDTEMHPVSTKNMAKSSCFPQTPSNQAPNPTFQLLAIYLVILFYKKLVSETLEPERQIFSVHLSLPISIAVDIFLPG